MDKSGDTDQAQRDVVVQPHTRAPEGWQETCLANMRPRPAIPSAIVFFISVVWPVVLLAPGAASESESLFLYLIPLGILCSCGLAIGAGFCSLFPQMLWLLLGAWGLNLVDRGMLPSYNAYVFAAGITAVLVMIGVQLWRIRTGRFVPTVQDVSADLDE